MKMEDIKVGMKVVPHNKSAYSNFTYFLNEDKNGEYYKKHGYLYVVKKLRDKIWLGSDTERPLSSYSFLPTDVTPYIEECTKVKVVDDGYHYCRYEELAKKYTNNILKFKDMLEVNNGDVLDLIEYITHPKMNLIKLAICKTKDNYIVIFDKKGVEEMKESSLLDSVFQNHVEVELRNGIKGIVVGNKIHTCADGCIVTSYEDYDKFLCDKLSNDFDIMEATLNGEVIYKREEKWSSWFCANNFISEINGTAFYRSKGSTIQVKVREGIVGESKCNPMDEYDFGKGLHIAYSRAMIKLHQKKLDELLK